MNLFIIIILKRNRPFPQKFPVIGRVHLFKLEHTFSGWKQNLRNIYLYSVFGTYSFLCILQFFFGLFYSLLMYFAQSGSGGLVLTPRRG